MIGGFTRRWAISAQWPSRKNGLAMTKGSPHNPSAKGDAKRGQGHGALGRVTNSSSPLAARLGTLLNPSIPYLVAAATGIQITVHDLRRTFVTVAGQSNISPLALKG